MAQRFHTFLMTTKKKGLYIFFISSQPEKNLDLSVKEESPIAFLQKNEINLEFLNEFFFKTILQRFKSSLSKRVSSSTKV